MLLQRTRSNPENSLIGILCVLVVCGNVRLLDASGTGTFSDAQLKQLREKRQAGTERTETASLIGTGSTTPANPNCKVSSYTLVGDDTHYYACCEGTTITGPDNVVNWDCEPARKTYAKINESRPFYCGGITGESNARQRCDERWKWLTAESCHKWTECFLGVCPFEAETRGSSVDAVFCGDGRCDASESRENCPSDCCGLENDRCIVANNTCPEPCCNEQSCCKASFGLLSTGQVWLVIIISVVGGILLINLLCCCCCFCCCRKCGSSRNGRNQSNVVV